MLLIAALTLVDAGPRFGWYELERDLGLSLSVARLLVLVFLFFRLARDLSVPPKVLVGLALAMGALCVLGLLFAVPPQTVILSPADEPLGEEIYGQRCARCHGPAGQGGSASSLADGIWAYGSSFDEVSLNIAAGLPGTDMPAFSSEIGTESVPFVTGYLFELEGAQPEQQD